MIFCLKVPYSRKNHHCWLCAKGAPVQGLDAVSQGGDILVGGQDNAAARQGPVVAHQTDVPAVAAVGLPHPLSHEVPRRAKQPHDERRENCQAVHYSKVKYGRLSDIIM